MCGFGCQNVTSNVEGFPMFWQTLQLPSSELMAVGEILELLCTSYIRQCVRSEAMIGLTKEWSADK